MTRDELDGPVADPWHHKILFENDHVRVLETAIHAGDITPLHSHLTPHVVYIASGSSFIRRDERGTTMVDTRADPTFVLPRVSFSKGNPSHTLENTGPDDLVAISIELKSAASRESQT